MGTLLTFKAPPRNADSYFVADSVATIVLPKMVWNFLWRHDTQLNDTQQKDTLKNGCTKYDKHCVVCHSLVIIQSVIMLSVMVPNLHIADVRWFMILIISTNLV